MIVHNQAAIIHDRHTRNITIRVVEETTTKLRYNNYSVSQLASVFTQVMQNLSNINLIFDWLVNNIFQVFVLCTIRKLQPIEYQTSLY